MVILTFIYMKNISKKNYDGDESIIEILKLYSLNIVKNINDLFFLINGEIISLKDKRTLKNFKKKKINIFIINNNKKKNFIKKENNILCPKCKDLAFINFKEDKLSITCSQNHAFLNVKLEEFLENQYIDESGVTCEDCENNKSLYEDNFYICECKKKICQLCYSFKLEHIKHKKINISQKLDYCLEHMDYLELYCFTCNKNLCFVCQEKHESSHNIISYKQMKIEKKFELAKKEFEENKSKINKYKNELKYISDIFTNVLSNNINEINTYIEFYQKISNCFSEITNYETIKNIYNCKNKKLLNDINLFLNDSFKNKIKYLHDTIDNKRKEINLSYKNYDNEDIIKIFGHKFVENNKDKVFLVINETIYELSVNYTLSNIDKKKKDKIIKIKLIILKKITNLNNMFLNCKALYAFSDILNFNASDVTDMSFMFFNCIKLKNASDLSKFDTRNVTNMSYMFYNCKYFLNAPDLSKWDTNKVINMNNIFYKSQKLSNISSLPKWKKEFNNEIILKYEFNSMNNRRIFGKNFVENNKDKCIILKEENLYSLSEFLEEKNINNKEKKTIEIKLIQIERITDLSYMFSDCDSLKYLPDISYLNTSYITNMSYLFNNCKSIENIPDISKWDTINVLDMSYMFSNCSSLKSLPNISNWNTSNTLYTNNMFYKCSSLLQLPDISMWNTGKIIDMSYLFSYCCSLKSLPNISKWNINKVINMRHIFSFCTSLEFISDISNWNTKNLKDISFMFYGCESLKYLPDISKWNIPNEIDFSYLFHDCFSVNVLPNISKWYTKKKKSNQISMMYYYNSGFSTKKKIRIFGEKFVKNNLNNCELIINNEKVNLSEFYEFGTYQSNIKLNVILVQKKPITDMSFMFYECDLLSSLIGFTDFDTNHVKNISYMLCNCETLTNIPDIYLLNTNHVIDMSYMFFNCESLSFIPDLLNWDTSNVIKMNNLFNGCSSLKTLPDISNWNTSIVKDLSHLFEGCKKLENISKISNWNTANVKKINHLFYGCNNLSTLPEKLNWDTNNIEDMSYMFFGNSKLLLLSDISKWSTNSLTNVSYMFYGCSSLKSFPDLSNWNISHATDMSYMFYECSGIETLPDLKWNTLKVKNMNYIFYGCSKLTSLPNFSNWKLNEINDIKNMFFGCNQLFVFPDISKWNITVMNIKVIMNRDNNNSLIVQESQKRIFGKKFCENNKNKCYLLVKNKKLPLEEFYDFEEDDSSNELEFYLIQKEIITDYSYMFAECQSLLSISLDIYWNNSEVTDISYMFYNCALLNSLPNLSIWNANSIKKMDNLFYGCESVASLPDISKWNTNQVIDMSYMFYGCRKLSLLPDISKWNTANITNMKSMFSYCLSLSSFPDISIWNTNNVKDISYIFYACESLKSLPNISKWNVNNVLDMSYMFHGCSSLSVLPDISGWNISNVKNLKSLFSFCKELVSLPDISNWDTINVTDMSCMFSGCTKLSSLPNISKWDITNVVDKTDIFKDCYNLKKLPKNLVSGDDDYSSRKSSSMSEARLSNIDFTRNSSAVDIRLSNINNENPTTFMEYIANRRNQCKGTHISNSICKECKPPAELIYIKQNTCKNHPVEKYCNNCIPPNIIIKRQTYSQVNLVSFMNLEEIDKFLQPWIDNFFQEQKMAFLYGYYIKEKNPPYKITAIVETLYEPPQLVNHNSFSLKEDKDKSLIDKLSEGLSLQCIGWIFTTLKEGGTALKSKEVIMAAKYQQEYSFIHSSGCHISRFITCVVSPNDLGEYKYETYMVSDMCQALVRDNIFDEINDDSEMGIRDAQKGEIMPIVYVENKETKIIDPNILIIDIDHNFISDKKDKNIIKTFDFPIISKNKKSDAQKKIKDYFNKYKKVDANVKCANLNFLIYIAKNFDEETALNIAKQISDKSLDWELVETLITNYIE